MSATAALLILVVTWIAIGVITAIVMGRRGHRPYSWALLGAVLGPLIVPLMISAARREEGAAPTLARSTSSSTTRSATSSGVLDILVGVDGSEDATGALVTAIALFGPHIGRLTVANVLDYDGGLTNVPFGEQDRAAAILERDALLAAGLLEREPERATLTGHPADALVQFARTHDYDMVVIAPRGRGASRVLFGSVASRLARGVGMPVVILPPARRAGR
jgi:nucleotide-binding universal stress UspA family protein